MFTIIISEKGGAERREAFDRNEINVGRVQGNDLMLAKGNVSKHHARLLYRDGRFIVTDLKSTNGTYVNGRKITQATIVREGDKIYVGDFVLRLETGQAAAAEAGGVEAFAQGSAGRVAPILRDPISAAGGAPSPQGGPLELPSSEGTGSSPSRPTIGAGGALSALQTPQGLRPAEAQGVSHFPIERDPDSESGPELRGAPSPGVPVPPRMPSPEGRVRATTVALGVEPTAPRRDSVLSSRAGSSPRPIPRQAARRGALIALVDRVADVVDLTPLAASPRVSEALTQQIDAAIREQAKAMRQDGEAPESVDLEQLANDALREMVGLGPIGLLLEDAEAQEIQVARPDSVLVVRRGQSSLVEPGFTSEAALARVVARLAHDCGEPMASAEAVVDRSLQHGERLTAVGPPVAQGWTLTIRRALRAEASIDEQFRGGAMSRSMATFLEACIAARFNVLVVGASSALVSSMIAALASASAAAERIAMLTDSDQVAVAHAYVTVLALGRNPLSDVDTMRAAARLRPDRLIVMPLAGAVASATVDAIGEGTEGVVAGVRAPSVRHALARVVTQVALARNGVSVESAREAVAESFDVAVEVVRGTDGRLRLLRVAELAGADRAGIVLRDLFVSNAEGTGDVGFVATGTIPRLAQDLAVRGIKLDPAIFKRK